MDHKALIYKGAVPDLCCCDATLRILPSGEFVVIFMGGGDGEPRLENHIRLCRSSDRGASWSAPETVMRFADRGCLLTEAVLDGEMLTLYGMSHRGMYKEWRNWTIRSGDGGRSWSAPEEFAPYPCRAFIRNRLILRNGNHLYPVQVYPVKDDPDSSPILDGSLESPANGALVSSDGGRSFRKSNLVYGASDWAENNVVELRDGRIAMLIRSDKTGCLFRTDSADGGLTWGEPGRTEIPNGGTKFRLFPLPDGRIALLHNPDPARRWPLALWISDDDMASWGYQRILTDFPGELQYPDGVVDADGTMIHFAFDYNRHDLIYWGAELPR